MSPKDLNLDQEHQTKQIFSKFDYELYDESKDVANIVYRVKRIGSLKEEKWKIFADNKLIITLDGDKVSKKEREFLRTLDGVNFLLQECKSGNHSISGIKKNLKKISK